VPPITRPGAIVVEAEGRPGNVVVAPGATVGEDFADPVADVLVGDRSAPPPMVKAATAASAQAPTPSWNLRTFTALEVTTSRSSFLVDAGSTIPETGRGWIRWAESVVFDRSATRPVRWSRLA